MTGSPLGVGVIGCGRVAQTVHLPALEALPEFRIVAVCDVDGTAADAAGERFGVADRSTRHEILLRNPDVDVVLVATREHSAPALAAIEAGKHLLVEKPLAFDVDSARTIADAAESAGVAAVMGYMRLYDQCFEAAQDGIRNLNAIRLVRVHDFACRHDKDDGLVPWTPGSAQPELQSFASLATPALGQDAAADWGTLYYVLLMLASHDFSIARNLLGAAHEVEWVDVAADQKSLVGAIRYERAPLCLMELSAASHHGWFDQQVTVYGHDQLTVIDFADPYVPHSRSQVTARTGLPSGYEDRTVTSGAEDAYRRQWRDLAACIREGRAPRADLRGAVADVELAVEIARMASRR